MSFPYYSRIAISQSKIEGYLLSSTHSGGRSKAVFFMQFGFKQTEWEILARALQDHVIQQDLVKIEETAFGTRYVVEGPLNTPDRRQPLVRSVWFIDEGDDVLRFVTAYPQ